MSKQQPQYYPSAPPSDIPVAQVISMQPPSGGAAGQSQPAGYGAPQQQPHIVYVNTVDADLAAAAVARRHEEELPLASHVIVNNNYRAKDKQGHYRCPVCGIRFANFPPFYRHQKTHGTQTFTCPLCSLRVDEPFYLQIHMRRTHDASFTPEPV